MSNVSQTEEFVGLLTESQRQLYVYVLALVGNSSDADEIVQETNLILWRKSNEFTSGTNFIAWALKTAYYEVLALRKRRGREQLQFEPDLVDVLATDAATHAETFESRRHALSMCMTRLSERDHELIRLRYGLGDVGVDSISELVRRVGRTVHATHQALHRIRTTLMECMQRRLAAEERA